MCSSDLPGHFLSDLLHDFVSLHVRVGQERAARVVRDLFFHAIILAAQSIAKRERLPVVRAG